MAIYPGMVFHGGSDNFKRSRSEPVTHKECGRTGILEVQTIVDEGRYFFLGRLRDDVPFEDTSPHRRRDVVCPRCGRIQRSRVAQDMRYKNEWTYLCERCCR